MTTATHSAATKNHPRHAPTDLGRTRSLYKGLYPDFQNAPPAKTKATIGPNRTANLFTVRISSPPPDSSPARTLGLSTGGLWALPQVGVKVRIGLRQLP